MDDRARRVRRRPHDVMLEAGATGDLDVGQRQRHPLALVDRALAVDDPLHASNVTGTTALDSPAPPGISCAKCHAYRVAARQFEPCSSWVTTLLTVLMSMAKPMLLAPLTPAVLIPTTWPAALTSGPPELPGLMAASVCRRPDSVSVSVEIVRSLAETIPSVTVGLLPRSRALPMASTSSPTCSVEVSASASGVAPCTSAIFRTATSCVGSVPTTVASSVVPSENVTVIEEAPSTTWLFVRT